MNRRKFIKLGATAAIVSPSLARAQQLPMPGVTDSEITLGQTMPYSGPLSAYAASYGMVHLAYFRMINDRGGVNGRKIKLLSLDDAYQPSKTVEQIRKLVEGEGIAATFFIFGTAPNRAVVKYLNDKRVPQFFAGTSGEGFADPVHQPWTMPLVPTGRMEGAIYGRYIAANMPGKRIAVLYQQDDVGKSYREGLREGLGESANLIVAEAGYQTSDPTIDSTIINLRASNAEVFFNGATIKHAAQAARKIGELNWKPTQFLITSASSVNTFLEKAGGKLQEGTISSQWYKNPADPQWNDDPEMQEWRRFMKAYYPAGDISEPLCVLSTIAAEAMRLLLERCGNDLSAANLLEQATSMKDVQLPLVLPGIKMNTSKTNYYPFRQMQLIRFSDDRWRLFGSVVE
jgi:ABC-type branched-subunit amino acid transport system substrate-binding protein